MISEARANLRSTFVAFSIDESPVLELDGERPTELFAFSGASVELLAGDTHYIYCFAGECALHTARLRFPLVAGMYAALPGAGLLSGTGRALVVSRRGYLGLFQLGGPIEAQGRLRYIDGCTDSVLLGPVVLGDPCLNHLHIPSHTRQTRHTHPSIRVGIIVRGRGRCVTPEADHELVPGTVFVIEKEELHAFHTEEQPLDVVVYHPDSDTGPTDADHPMKNRTIIARSPGVSR
jgi:hypothetical protein